MTVAIIGGSGFYTLDNMSVQDERHVDTPFGQAADAITFGHVGEASVLFLPRHGKNHALPPHQINYRANLHALKVAGATTIIAVHAVGGIDCALKAGDIVLPEQLIDYTYGRAHTFSDGKPNVVVANGVEHIDFTHPFTPSLRQKIILSAQAASIPLVISGVYGCTQGPRLESAAEIQRMSRDGCTLVGMTAMPEAALAAELGMSYVSISMVANLAAGLGSDKIELAEIHRVITNTGSLVTELIQSALA